METLKAILPVLRPGSWGATLDFKDAYLHIPMHHSARPESDSVTACFLPRGTDVAIQHYQNQMAGCCLLIQQQIYCTESCGQGTECTLEDLEAEDNAQLLQALNATNRGILENELKIRITHDYQQYP